MQRLIYQGFIEDVRNEKCTDQEIEKLIDVFEEAAEKFLNKEMTQTSEKIFLNMIDFKEAKENGIENFDFTLEITKIENGKKFTSKFCDGRKNFKVIANVKN